jgi:HEPN domain-containing protein
VQKAENDLLNIENNLAAGRTPWDTVCFHAQQAAEKVLKAFLIYHQEPAPRTHDLTALLARYVEVNPELSNLEGDCRRLTYYAVSARYPDDHYEPDEQDGRAMNAAARRVVERVMVHLPDL